MKLLMTFLLLTIFGNNNGDMLQEYGFIKISKELSERRFQVQKIIPDKKYRYWEFVSNNSLLRKEGNNASYNIKTPRGGFFGECLPGYCYSYIATVEGDTINYIITEADFRRFIGRVDNVEEALLLSRTYYLYIDDENPRGGAYKKTSKGFELMLMKYYLCPEKKESIKLTIGFNGEVSMESKGFYYESKNCIVI